MDAISCGCLLVSSTHDGSLSIGKWLDLPVRSIKGMFFVDSPVHEFFFQITCFQKFKFLVQETQSLMVKKAINFSNHHRIWFTFITTIMATVCKQPNFCQLMQTKMTRKHIQESLNIELRFSCTRK